MSLRALSELERLRTEFGARDAGRKLELVRALSRSRLASARAVERLHECLCFLRAYADDAEVHAEVVRALAGFGKRRDLRRVRAALSDTGIAGTDLRFRFYQPTAVWLSERCPRALHIDWDEFDGVERLEPLMALLLPWAETQALDLDLRSVRRRIEALRGARESDARFLARRIDALPASADLKRHLYDEIDPPLVLRSGPGTPSRTHAAHPVKGLAFQRGPMRSERPELKSAVDVPPLAIRDLSPREGLEYVHLAREAMAVRARDLDAFMYADARDARLVDCGEGLAFACLGVVPEERLLLEAVYAFLTLKNGVPIGYVLASAIHGSCEVAYNVFETFRGAEAAWIYARVLAMLRALFGADTFTVYPYQLGHENEEGLRSGAWWFYQKLGFRPRERATLALMLWHWVQPNR